MPSQKMKTHKGIKKRFKVSATGKVSHKRCGSSHLNSHMSGGKIRRLRRKSTLKIAAVSQKFRRRLGVNETNRPISPDRLVKGKEGDANANASASPAAETQAS